MLKLVSKKRGQVGTKGKREVNPKLKECLRASKEEGERESGKEEETLLLGQQDAKKKTESFEIQRAQGGEEGKEKRRKKSKFLIIGQQNSRWRRMRGRGRNGKGARDTRVVPINADSWNDRERGRRKAEIVSGGEGTGGENEENDVITER